VPPLILLETSWRHQEKCLSAPLCQALRAPTYASTPTRQQEPGISAHLNTFLRASSHFSRFAGLYQPTNRGKDHVSLFGYFSVGKFGIAWSTQLRTVFVFVLARTPHSAANLQRSVKFVRQQLFVSRHKTTAGQLLEPEVYLRARFSLKY